jgi:hypothetical protein
MSAATHTLSRSPAWVVQPGALRRFAAVFVAGGFAGLIAGGIGSRLAMRIAALAAPEAVHGFPTEAGARIGEITMEGTVFLILFAGISSALIGSGFYVLVGRGCPADVGSGRSRSAASSSWCSAPVCSMPRTPTSRSSVARC